MNIIIIVILFLSTTFANREALKELIRSNNNFAASIYKVLASKSDENFVVSPLSALLVLSLVNSGAKSETADEIRNVLHLPYCQHIINEEINTLLQNFGQDPDYVLQIINKIYLKEDYQIHEEFSTIARELYGAEIENLNFSCKYQSANIINKWVEEVTEEKITDLIDPEFINNKTRTILVNALRLKANWTTPFQYFATVRQDFYSFDSIVNLDIMHIYDEQFQFYEKPHLNATFLELPLNGDNVTMTIALPKDVDGLPLLEKYIEEVFESPDATYSDNFHVALPKFKLESSINFKDVLQNLGVKKPFEDGGADFTGIAGFKGELFISEIVQKSFLEVDRNGIEAAAATYIVKIVNRNGGISRDFIVDHPFIFYIKVHNMIVFMGRMILP